MLASYRENNRRRTAAGCVLLLTISLSRMRGFSLVSVPLMDVFLGQPDDRLLQILRYLLRCPCRLVKSVFQIIFQSE